MQEKILDCRGLPCPRPVLECKQVIDSGYRGQIQVVVDNEPARENVSRFLDSQGYAVLKSTEQDREWILDCAPREDQNPRSEDRECPQPEPASPSFRKKTLICITRNKLGSGDNELGAGLMHNFLATLPEMGDELWRVILLNAGVRLAVRDSGCLGQIKALADSGVSVLVCGTCLNHFQLLEEKQIGETTNMLDVVTSLQLADKVITV
ncbi:MAG: sulfurtransferase-like selenium metabolism protein YedF [Desulfonatronovibrionaceae bacterium]